MALLFARHTELPPRFALTRSRFFVQPTSGPAEPAA